MGRGPIPKSKKDTPGFSAFDSSGFLAPSFPAVLEGAHGVSQVVVVRASVEAGLRPEDRIVDHDAIHLTCLALRKISPGPQMDAVGGCAQKNDEGKGEFQLFAPLNLDAFCRCPQQKKKTGERRAFGVRDVC